MVYHPYFEFTDIISLTPPSPHHESIHTCGQDNDSPCSSSTATPTAVTTAQNTSISQATEVDPIVGQVTLGGRFTCLSKACRNDETLTFNRHADFKRHYTNMHARKLTEYFCPEKGCHRSRYPADGKKGRSFKGRRDKMKEHMKTVHDNRARKRRRIEESEEKDED